MCIGLWIIVYDHQIEMVVCTINGLPLTLICGFLIWSYCGSMTLVHWLVTELLTYHCVMVEETILFATYSLIVAVCSRFIDDCHILDEIFQSPVTEWASVWWGGLRQRIGWPTLQSFAKHCDFIVYQYTFRCYNTIQDITIHLDGELTYFPVRWHTGCNFIFSSFCLTFNYTILNPYK